MQKEANNVSRVSSTILEEITQLNLCNVRRDLRNKHDAASEKEEEFALT